MSEYVVMELNMSDSEAIKQALAEMGYPFEEHVEAASLVGYEGRSRSQKANIIVRRQHVGSAANDVGFVKKADGSYELIISEYDRAAKKQAHDFTVRIKQLYAKHLSIKQLKKIGVKSTPTQTVTTDNRIKLKWRIG